MKTKKLLNLEILEKRDVPASFSVGPIYYTNVGVYPPPNPTEPPPGQTPPPPAPGGGVVLSPPPPAPTPFGI